MNELGLEALVGAVQANCRIADARHARELPLCIYLLQMRELYRWERQLPFGAVLDRQAVGSWLAQRELLWDEIGDGPFVPLPIDGEDLDPLDADGVNARLAPSGLFYGAGRSIGDRHDFVLARLHAQRRHADGLALTVCGDELARGIHAAAAALVDDRQIIVRRDSLARQLWEKYESFVLYQSNPPFAALLDGHGVHGTADFVAALPSLVDELTDVLVLHECGEHRAGRRLDPAWSALRGALASRRLEGIARALRDQLADLEVTLPSLLQRGAGNALHFWFANYDGVRRELFPSLPAAYDAWRDGDDGAALRRAAAAGCAHFRSLAERAVELHARAGIATVERLLTAPEAVCRPPSGAA